ncbi:MAG TPA: Flp family type IVb pilin [Geobacteraceae bacterium]|nr:Flp family type IVb pilin [Geobacteraceae bacterium]
MKKCRGLFPSLKSVVKNRRGQTLIEYGMVLILIAVIIVAMVLVIGEKTNNTYSTIGSSFPQPP